ncbi:uncharacterized protein LOC115547316 isoform X3 [Gadus morhua]|uniref:uncharacterized protein LOC115547316 isoform X3 n=1 Tax=Gadus morhua TaxID=8049 RepID=UPI0011B3E778|nr:uncharacterized protein LOC115547316 isoform X3 [Gadus morhua]
MPRPSRASSAGKMRMKKILPMATTLAKGFEPVHGTGARHCVKPWPVSPHTEKFNRLVLPLECPDKQFVLFVGDSHLRALADGYVKMPDGCLSFGFLSTPGASAAELRTELLNADIGRTPDIVCLLAPSNNLTATPSIETAGVAFNGLLRAACSRWPKVFVLDFPPRLASELAPQQFLREEFRRVAAKNGVNYCLTADRFPLDSRALWSHDGIHLSDDLGMQVLAKLLWHFSYRQLEAASPLPVTPPPVVPPRSPPTVRSLTTTVVVKGEVSRPRPLDPFKETVVGRHGKRSQPENWDAPEDWDQSCMRILSHEVCVPPVVLQEYPVVLNPILFSTDTLAAIDRIVPSNLDSPMYATMANHTKKRKVAHGTTAVEAFKTPATIAEPSKLLPPRPVLEAAVPATLEGRVFVHSSNFSQLEGDDKSLCVDEWPFLQTEKLKVNQPTAQVVSRQRQQEEPAAWGPKVVKAQADKPTANETSFLGCSTRMTHIEDHEQDEPAPEVTANSQQQSPPEVNCQLEDPHATRGNQKAPCDVAPARAATSSHVTYENPGCLKGSFDQSSHIFGDTDSDSDLCVLSVTDRNSLAVNTSFSLETEQPVANTSKCDTTVNIDSDLPIHTDGASDVCLISVTDSPNIIFNGLTLREKNRICNKLNIVPSLDQNIVAQTFDMGQPEPCKTTPIEGDGNCFFRSLSSVISGCESHHKAFRKAVVNHISNNPLHYITEFASVEQYLRDSKMKYVGSWATVLEIQASADLLCVDICTYSQQKWITFTSNIEPILRKAIYLKHFNERHYEPIACVKEKTSLTCFSLTSFCEMSHKMSNADLVSPRKKCSDKVKNLRKRKRYAEDTEYRQFKKLKAQLRYYWDEQYQAKQKASSIEKYANNEAFREQVKKSSIEKYAKMKRSKNK